MDYVAALVTAVGMVLVGKRRWYGWGVTLAAEALWLAYAIRHGIGGLALLCVIYAVVYARNLVVWRRAERSTTPNS